jgi:hypothetical protein
VDAGAGDTRVPAQLEDADLVDLYRLDRLAVEYAAAAASYRRVGKGAVLRAEGEDFVSEADDELEGLLRSVDERHDGNGGLAAGYGALVDFHGAPPEDEEPGLTVVVPELNLSEEDPRHLEQLLNVHLSGPTNYVPRFLELDDFRDFLSKFDDAVVAEVGASSGLLMAVIWALSTNLILRLRDSPLPFLQITNTGYYVVTDAQWESVINTLAPHVGGWLREIAGLDVDAEAAKKQTQKGLEVWTYRPEDLTEISLWDRLPFKLLITVEGFTLFDLSAIPEALSGLARSIGFLAGDVGNVKAEDFEDRVEARAAEAGFPYWQKRKVLVAGDGSQRELDAGFIVGDTLFVVECKAFSQNPRIDRGDFAALKARRETLEKYLGQARTMADFLEANRKGRNYEVPVNVLRFDYLLCTPGVEYIWTRDPAMWMTTETPRICTPGELTDLFREANARLPAT